MPRISWNELAKRVGKGTVLLKDLIKKHRKIKGLTTKQLAEVCNCKEEIINQIEKEGKIEKFQLIPLLAKVLEISPKILMEEVVPDSGIDWDSKNYLLETPSNVYEMYEQYAELSRRSKQEIKKSMEGYVNITRQGSIWNKIDFVVNVVKALNIPFDCVCEVYLIQLGFYNKFDTLPNFLEKKRLEMRLNEKQFAKLLQINTTEYFMYKNEMSIIAQFSTLSRIAEVFNISYEEMQKYISIQSRRKYGTEYALLEYDMEVKESFLMLLEANDQDWDNIIESAREDFLTTYFKGISGMKKVDTTKLLIKMLENNEHNQIVVIKHPNTPEYVLEKMLEIAKNPEFERMILERIKKESDLDEEIQNLVKTILVDASKKQKIDLKDFLMKYYK